MKQNNVIDLLDTIWFDNATDALGLFQEIVYNIENYGYCSVLDICNTYSNSDAYDISSRFASLWNGLSTRDLEELKFWISDDVDPWIEGALVHFKGNKYGKHYCLTEYIKNKFVYNYHNYFVFETTQPISKEAVAKIFDNDVNSMFPEFTFSAYEQKKTNPRDKAISGMQRKIAEQKKEINTLKEKLVNEEKLLKDARQDAYNQAEVIDRLYKKIRERELDLETIINKLEEQKANFKPLQLKDIKVTAALDSDDEGEIYLNITLSAEHNDGIYYRKLKQHIKTIDYEIMNLHSNAIKFDRE